MPAVTAVPGIAALGRYISFFLGLYVATRLYMVFDSGLPQPSDIGLALGLAVYLRPSHVTFGMRQFPAYAAFVAWVGAVSVSWAVLRWDPQYLVHFSFQLFNLLLFTIVLLSRLADGAHFDRWVERGVVASAVGQFVALLSDGRTFRAQGSFNNENQLGYWAVCALGIYTVVRPRPTVRDLPVVALILWAELVSTSRAGIVACGLMLVVWGWQLFVRSRQRFILMGAAALGTLAFLAFAGVQSVTNSEIYDNFVHRFTKDSSTDEVGFRNIDRISSYPEYALLGAGEGDLERFPHSLSTIEIHSTPATILFSYGVVGSMLFWTFVAQLARRLDGSGRMALLALVLYSVTHNGMRFTYSWFLIALLASQTLMTPSGLRAAAAPARFVRPPRRLRRSEPAEVAPG